MVIKMQRNAESLNVMSHKLEYGIGVKKNLKRSYELRLKSAEMGYKEAQFLLGCIYLGETGYPPNHEKAVYWLTKAADQGEFMAMLHLAEILHKKNNVEAWKWVVIASHFESELSLESDIFKVVSDDMNESDIVSANALADAWLKEHQALI